MIQRGHGILTRTKNGHYMPAVLDKTSGKIICGNRRPEAIDNAEVLTFSNNKVCCLYKTNVRRKERHHSDKYARTAATRFMALRTSGYMWRLLLSYFMKCTFCFLSQRRRWTVVGSARIARFCQHIKLSCDRIILACFVSSLVGTVELPLLLLCRC